jgi:dihydroorotate dehydrogenase electron transfer subunit
VADYYLACGPKLMLKALSGLCAGLRRPLQVSLGERMGCGYGACVGCTCKTKEKDSGLIQRKKVCLDGPVFLGEEVVWDE